MRPTRAPTQHERLVNDLSLAAIDLQALAQRLANTEGLPVSTRSHALRVAEAGRAVCLAAVTANGGHHTDDLRLYYGEWLTAGPKRDALHPLEETGLYNKFKPVAQHRATLLEAGAPVAPAS